MTSVPSVLFMSCSDTQPDDIIKLLMGDCDLPERIYIDENIHAFPWFIDNKYYETIVNLCSLKSKTISNKEFSETVEAVVLHFDSSSNDAINAVNSWLPFINEYSPEIKILLCNSVSNDDNSVCSKRSVQEWCIDKGFELVELEPIIEDDENDLENDFFETTGIKRIIQALNAHVWPNLKMKTENNKPISIRKPINDLNNLNEKLHLEESLEEMLENDDDFSQLFSQLSDMKARVASLSGDDRKAAAEQVVKAFWKALGGDDEELLLDM